MLKITNYNISGEESGTTNLNPEIFGIKPNPTLLHQAVVRQLANKRVAIANTKTRGEVRGGGRKPWKQKGTGRARAGTIRSPLWIGGGITFGPTKERNFKKNFPKKMRRKALFIALSSKLSDKKMIVLDKLEFLKIKTRQAIELLEKLPVEYGNFLIIIKKSDNNLKMSFSNLSYAKLLPVDNLNVIDVLKYDWLVITKDALDEIDLIYSKEHNYKDKNLIINKTKKQSVKPVKDINNLKSDDSIIDNNSDKYKTATKNKGANIIKPKKTIEKAK